MAFAESVLGSLATRARFPECERAVGNMSLDTIANMLSALKNASMASAGSIELPYFRQGKEILEVFKQRGLVNELKVFKPEGKDYKYMHVDLATGADGARRILETRRISKPGNRVCRPYAKLAKVKAGLGVVVVSTSRGVMAGEEARKKKLGGEVLCSCFFK
ncbi:TPA: 30S ribosomal protein S8 [candidate division WWE3 bacterium]|uniref:Small ribosomal subunit protein uS8 n=4 Tax=Katanobacteria TaxID=422282 RepID=A0A0G1KNF3_UNCKA|nr:MAG: 30S ribosomal protein S8 [candidate division WWE3 bacterium GW2011_GWA2_44_16]KKT70154.1 MAG: 30S ribosomal protein S8 [candidate division WWE3 bacterium GW2011_GWB1_44_4]KKT85010.1 MAG: 30S ribosomal protein S8 [candidate division WWE3 bacterium GW2011_GWC2_44_9]HAZ29305.1 30S ribosomal protein S8 [candidate division WWE3 bacterium]